MIRIPSHIQRSRRGIWFFRVVVPKNLRRALDGRGEIKKSLGTRDSREALRVALPLAFAAKELFARLEASLSRQPTVDEILANAAAARELKTTNKVDLGGGRSLSYSLETSSNDPAEIAAFHAEAARLQAVQDEKLARYQEKPVSVPEAMLEYQRKEQDEMARFKAELAAQAKQRELAQPDAQDDEDAPAFRPDPENVISSRWAEFVAQREGNTWTAKRTTPAFKRMFEEFQTWWGGAWCLRNSAELCSLCLRSRIGWSELRSWRWRAWQPAKLMDDEVGARSKAKGRISRGQERCDPQEPEVNGPELRRLFRRVLANATAREDEAAGSRCLRVEIEGVDCAATFKVRLVLRMSNGVRRIDGECMAYLSCIECDTLASGFGWLRFGIAARSASQGEVLESLFEWALRDARAELVLHPEFIALRELGVMSACVASPPTCGSARSKSL